MDRLVGVLEKNSERRAEREGQLSTLISQIMQQQTIMMQQQDVIDDVGKAPDDVEDLFACDPGKVNLFNVARAHKVSEEEAPPGAVPLGDGQ